MKNRVVHTDRMQPHPLNRDFAISGEKWDSFFESVRSKGVIQPLLVRYLGDTLYQVLAGHRRLKAALLLGIEKLDCVVRELSDHEALELLVMENLEREDLDPVEEGKLVRAMLEDGMSAEELANRLSRSLEWVQTRQGLLDLGDEVCAALRRPKDDEGHLHIGTVQVLLAVDQEDREQAVQLVLHPDWKLGALNAREASDVIRTSIIEPRRKKEEWETSAPKFVKAWRKRLAELLTKDEAKELIVQAVGWDAIATGVKMKKPAEEALDRFEEVATEATGKTWLHLAIQNGLPVWIVPTSGDEQSTAVVDESLLRLAEHSKESTGLVSWLLTKKKPAANPAPAESLQVDSGASGSTVGSPVGELMSDERVEAALAAADGAPNPGVDLEPEAETVIEQVMESRAFVDLGPVRRLRGAAAGLVGSGMEWEDYIDATPEWVKQAALPAEDVVVICDWFLALKGSVG